MAMNTTPALTAGMNIVVTKGCDARNVRKGMNAKVLEVTEGERREAKVRIEFPTRWSESRGVTGSTLVFYARHVNRLSDPVVGMNDGNPLHRIEVRRK
jgi:hypothetical protein